MIRVGVLTISDRATRGEAEDRSGPAIMEIVQANLEAEIVRQELIPDERPIIEEILRRWCDAVEVDLVLTTGGTGFAPRDVTPEATQAVIERPAPGFAEAMRAASLQVHSARHAQSSRIGHPRPDAHYQPAGEPESRARAPCGDPAGVGACHRTLAAR